MRFGFSVLITMLSPLLMTSPLLAATPLRPPMVSVQSFPGYLEITYDQEILKGTKDVLFVIDDSGSMSPHQKNLAAMTDKLIEGILANPTFDLRVGVIKTSLEPNAPEDHGKLVRTGGAPYVDRQTAEPSRVLRQNLLVGTNGNGIEMPFAAVDKALSPELLTGDNTGFLRPGADLKVVLFTDAEDQSTINVDQVLQRLGAVTLHSTVDAFIATTENQCPMDNPQAEPLRISDLVAQTSGQTYSICDTAKMEAALRAILNPAGGAYPTIEIPLPMAPDPLSLVVTYGTQVIPGGASRTGWIYDEDRQVLVIGPQVNWTTQPKGTRLKVRYVPQDWR